MPRPIIGISCNVREENGKTFYLLHRAYVASVRDAGGIPFLIPADPDLATAKETLDALDGVLFTGGDDIDVRPLGQALHPKAETMPALRQRSEFALLKALDQRPDLPVLGICLGMQLMGVHGGCPLIQHLHDVIKDGDRHVGNKVHAIAGSIGAGPVTSSHHQAIGAAGPFETLALSDDGVLEAIRMPDRAFYVGVQWHPERTEDKALGLGIVKMLVDAAKIHAL
ncbi:MAG: gamma-glutamyl-gamma-aminobutyrate hydrolase family protein [Planctomycetes bacterium]|nr:gamma-glutamyl-gamma-aminobutyrate hydrolase family protein [Planctomycetota bacterium]